jgi:hypothetical protein
MTFDRISGDARFFETLRQGLGRLSDKDRNTVQMSSDLASHALNSQTSPRDLNTMRKTVELTNVARLKAGLSPVGPHLLDHAQSDPEKALGTTREDKIESLYLEICRTLAKGDIPKARSAYDDLIKIYHSQPFEPDRSLDKINSAFALFSKYHMFQMVRFARPVARRDIEGALDLVRRTPRTVDRVHFLHRVLIRALCLKVTSQKPPGTQGEAARWPCVKRILEHLADARADYLASWKDRPSQPGNNGYARYLRTPSVMFALVRAALFGPQIKTKSRYEFDHNKKKYTHDLRETTYAERLEALLAVWDRFSPLEYHKVLDMVRRVVNKTDRWGHQGVDPPDLAELEKVVDDFFTRRDAPYLEKDQVAVGGDSRPSNQVSSKTVARESYMSGAGESSSGSSGDNANALPPEWTEDQVMARKALDALVANARRDAEGMLSV